MNATDEKKKKPPGRNRPGAAGAVAAAAALIFLAAAVFVAGPLKRGIETGGGNKRTPVPRSDAMASLHFLHAQRAYPEPDIPDRKYTEAFEQVRTQLQLARLRGGRESSYEEPPPWTPIGPKNVGGRTNALAINPLDPQIIYAGAASGGLWRTDSGGKGREAWHYLETGFPVLGVNAIAIDPSDTSTVYIGTGEVYGKETSIGGLYIRTTRGSYGIGILKSTDGGATWSKSLDWSYNQRRGVLALEIDPTDPQVVFAGTSEGVYRSRDRGESWTRVLGVSMAVDIAINPVNGDTVFASCGNLYVPTNAGIYRSVDGGDTWTELGGGLPFNWTGKTLLDIYPMATNVIYADVANALSDNDPTGVGLYRSLDSGETWEHISAGYSTYWNIAKYQGWFSHFVVVNPADSSKVLVSGVDTYKSYDGGRTFEQKSYWWAWYGGIIPIGGPEGPSYYSHADHHNFARHPTDPSTVYLATDGGIFETNDFGETFAGRNGGYQTTQFYGGFSSSIFDADLAIGGLQDNSTVIYRGGPAWQMTLGGDGGMTGFSVTDPDLIIASTQYGRLYKSMDGGLRWSPYNQYNLFQYNRVMSQSGEGVAFVAPFAQAPSDRSIAYAGRTRVWRSDHYIENWRVPGSATPLDGNPVLTLSVYPGDPDLVWAATVPSSRRAGVFRSTDGGQTWSNITRNLPDRYPVDIVANPSDPDMAYVVFSGFGTSHLFRTVNGGLSWEDVGVGLPDIPTSALAVDAFNQDYLYLGNDFGVWFSPDGGRTWELFSDGMPTAALVMDLSVSIENASIRAVTHGLGVWERTLVSAVSALAEEEQEGVRLFQNLPNPFNSETLIAYDLPGEMRVRLEIFNIRGQFIRELRNELQGGGRHFVTVRSRDLPTGIYIYRLVAGDQVRTRKFMIIK